MSKENVDTVRHACESFNRPNLEGLAELVSPSWVLDWSQSVGPQKGTYKGMNGAAEWIEATREAFESFQVEPFEFLDSGDQVVVRAHVRGRGRGSGVEVNATGTTVWELRDGKVVRMTLYQDDDQALEAAGLDG